MTMISTAIDSVVGDPYTGPNHNKLRIQVVSDVARISPSLVDAWRDLATNPMCGPDWLLPWWKHYRKNGDVLQLVLFFNHDQLVALAHLYRENGKHIKLLGSGKVCSDHAQLLIGCPNHLDRAGDLLLDWLMGNQCPNWSSIQLESIDNESHTVELLDRWDDRVSVWSEPGESVCAISLPKTWDDYLKSLSKNHRKRVRRWTRQHLDSGQLQRRSTRDDWDINEAFECLVLLHNMRRGNLPEKGAFEDRRFCDFHREAVQKLARQNQASISAIFLDGQPQAIEYELHNQDTVFAYQSGLNVESELASPGSVSILNQLQIAVANGMSTFDLMRGNEPYKQHWKAERRNTSNIRIWPRTTSGNIARLGFLTRESVKSTARRLRKMVKRQSSMEN